MNVKYSTLLKIKVLLLLLYIILLVNATHPILQASNCFDYTTTLFDVDTDNDLGFTTGMTIDP